MIIERALGVMVAMTLRSTAIIEYLKRERFFETIVELMYIYDEKGRIQRQCCMLIRNCAVHGALVKVFLHLLFSVYSYGLHRSLFFCN